MRVQVIEMADFLVSWTVAGDSEGVFRWVVRVTDRGDGHATVLERRGRCGRVSWGDAQDIAAENARRVAAALIEPAAPQGQPRPPGPLGPLAPDFSAQHSSHAKH